MGYSLKIRADGFIDFDEWMEILEATEDFVRVSTREFVEIKAPNGGMIKCPVSTGSGEVFFPEENEWYVVFTYNDSGYITFRSPPQHSKENPAWSAAVALATLLDGYIVGEAGERYDLNTGEEIEMTEADHAAWEQELLEDEEDFEEEEEEEEEDDDDDDDEARR